MVFNGPLSDKASNSLPASEWNNTVNKVEFTAAPTWKDGIYHTANLEGFERYLERLLISLSIHMIYEWNIGVGYRLTSILRGRIEIAILLAISRGGEASHDTVSVTLSRWDITLGWIKVAILLAICRGAKASHNAIAVAFSWRNVALSWGSKANACAKSQ
jgi:hypothetical protein